LSKLANFSKLRIYLIKNLAVNDVRRELTFCNKVGIPIAGIVENMSGFSCPHCKDCSYIFTKDGGKILAEKSNCKFLGSIPIDPILTTCIENGRNFLETLNDSAVFKNMKEITDILVQASN
jgi:hypothetical protein